MSFVCSFFVCESVLFLLFPKKKIMSVKETQKVKKKGGKKVKKGKKKMKKNEAREEKSIVYKNGEKWTKMEKIPSSLYFLVKSDVLLTFASTDER